MTSEQVRKLSRYGRLTVAALILFGGVRVGLHVVVVVHYFGTDEATLQAEYLETCKGFFGEANLPENGGPPLASFVPEGQSRCQALAEQGFQIRGHFLVWHMVLWVIAGLLSLATLLVAFMVLKRNPNAARYMFIVFIAQVLASLGEIAKAVLEGIQKREIILALWPDLDTTGPGWLYLNSEMAGTIAMYTILCLFYAGLVRNVRSNKAWE
ncbi:MAG: hypothetical protein GY847_14120 [Proteobacteria bacterium]|nr:hypothetical protein [Pseudomonadota bacterium]